MMIHRIQYVSMMRYIRMSVVFAVALSAASCAFSRLKSDVAAGQNAWTLDIQVKMNSDTQGKVIAVAYTPYKDAQRVAAFKVLDPDIHRALIILDPGTYRLVVFHDKNGNLNVDSGEPVFLAERGRSLKFSEVVRDIKIEVSLPTEGALPEGYPGELATLPDSIQGDYHIAVGDIMDIRESKFSAEAGRMGLWEPTRFLKENGAGIYMTGEFDPQKTPVLFVNGAGGSAQNWKYFFEHLDKTHFQAWFFLYPSGMRIAKLGRALNSTIRAMEKKFGITRLHVVAHSMGGLVSREAIVNHIADEQPSILGQFVTISTPWNGHKMAEKGVSALSVPVPSWHDVVPGSEFLQSVFASKLKSKVPHHLLFGFQVGSDGDGSVDLRSVLLSEAQDDAVEVRAFEANHVTILSMEPVLDYVENILLQPEPVPAAAPSEGDTAETDAEAPCPPCAEAPSSGQSPPASP